MKIQENKKTIERSRVVGMKDLCVAEVTTNSEDAYAAGTPERLANAISATIKETFEVEYLYSDDRVEDSTETFVKAEIELEVNRLTPGDYANLFDSLYADGYLVKTDEDKAKEIAVGFRARQNNGKYEFVWYYSGKAEHPEESYETIKEKKTAQTQKLTITCYARQKEETINGRKRHAYALKVDESQLLEEHANATAAIAEWFKEVQERKTEAA